MAAVIGGRDEVLPLVAQIEGLEIAACNAPRALTVSGDESAIRQLLARLPDVGATGLALPVSHAFHSRHLDPILPEFERYVRAVERKPPSLLLVSNVTGRSVAGDVSRSGYWVEQMRRPVQFESALRWLSEREQIGAYLEVGPDRVLGSFVRQCVPGVANVSTLVHSQPEVNTALAAAASLWVQGVSIDWSGPRLLCGGESGGDVQTARPERAILDELQAGALTVSQAMELMLEARRGAVRTAATGRV
jgi:acyl transferase domain-containing protein